MSVGKFSFNTNLTTTIQFSTAIIESFKRKRPISIQNGVIYDDINIAGILEQAAALLNSQAPVELNNSKATTFLV